MVIQKVQRKRITPNTGTLMVGLASELAYTAYATCTMDARWHLFCAAAPTASISISFIFPMYRTALTSHFVPFSARRI